jgi:iron complex outermembrane receptor protein
MNKSYSTWLKSTIGFSIIALLSFGSSTIFSADEEESSDEVEEVVVTGSRIKRISNYDSTGPVEVYGVQTILDSGKNNIGDFLLELPSANLASNQRSINNGNSGTTEFNLRGAGSERLLTLINGRRVAPSGTGTGSAVDMQIFPLALIDSIEVLKDGASAVYGSDAISGVLNIKLREFEGFELMANEGSSNQGDAKQDLISIAFGSAGERSSIVATISASKNDSLDMWDRDFSFCPRLEPDYMLYFQAYVPGHGNSGDNLGDGASCGASTFIPTGRFYTSSGSKTLFGDVGPNGPTSTFNWWQYSGNGPGDPQNNMGMYNYSEWMQLLGGRENYQAWSAGTFELEGGVVLDFELGASKRKSDLMMAPVPMGSGAQFTYGMTIPAANPFNPFGEDLAYRKRMLDVGPRMFSQEADTFRFVFGASGTLDRLGDADWELYHTYQEFSSTQLTENYINMIRVERALTTELGAGVQVNGVGYRCVDAVARKLGCVPLNMFGGNSITADAADYIRFNQLNRTGTIYKGYSGNIANIELAELPAGKIMAAVGFDISDLSGSEKVDALTEAGYSSGNPRLSTEGSYSNRDFYGEVSIPILADKPGFKELNLDGAYRHTSYSDFASDTVDRIALKWKPIDDVTVRATSSTSYKAPTIADLNFGGGGGFPTYVDPCEQNVQSTYTDAQQTMAAVMCAAEGLDTATWATSNNQILAFSVGNPNLIPENGSNETFGVVWQPTSIEVLENINFKMAVDSFELEIENAVVGSGSQNALNQCYLEGRTDYCALISRSYGGDVNSVEYNYINSESLSRFRGVDYSVNMTFDDLKRIGGSLEVDVIGTHFKENVSVDASGVSDDYVGACYDFGESCFNRDRINLSLRYYKNDWRIGLSTRFLSGIDPSDTVKEYFGDGALYGIPYAAGMEEEILGIYSVPDYHISTLNVAYSFTEHFNANITVSNLFDREPPYYKDFFGFVDPQINTPQNTYDVVGRYFQVGFKLTY